MAALLDLLAPVQGPTPCAEAHLVHDIPGRLRFVLPAAKGNPRQGVALRARLREFKAVRNIHINPLTGSVLVEYDVAGTGREAVVHALEEAGYRLTRQARQADQETARSRTATLAMNAVLDWIIERAMHGALAAVV